MSRIDLIIAINAVLVALVGYLTYYWKSHAKKLGELDATIDKIGVITTIVEEIKAKMDKETEAFKSELEIKKEKRIDLYKEEKDTIVGLYERVVVWRDRLINEDYYDNLLVNQEKLIQYKYLIDSSRTNLVEYLHRANLFIKSESMFKAFNLVREIYDKFDYSILAPYMNEWIKIHTSGNRPDEKSMTLMVDGFIKRKVEYLVQTDEYYFNLIDEFKKRIEEIGE